MEVRDLLDDLKISIPIHFDLFEEQYKKLILNKVMKIDFYFLNLVCIMIREIYYFLSY